MTKTFVFNVKSEIKSENVDHAYRLGRPYSGTVQDRTSVTKIEGFDFQKQLIPFPKTSYLTSSLYFLNYSESTIKLTYNYDASTLVHIVYLIWLEPVYAIVQL